MTIEQMLVAAQWMNEHLDPQDGIYTLEYNEFGIAIYQDDGLTTRNIGYVRVSDGRVVLWYPERKTNK